MTSFISRLPEHLVFGVGEQDAAALGGIALDHHRVGVEADQAIALGTQVVVGGVAGAAHAHDQDLCIAQRHRLLVRVTDVALAADQSRRQPLVQRGGATRLICAEMMNDSATVIASGISHCGNTTLATIRPNSL